MSNSVDQNPISRFAGIEINLNYKALEIYLSGCKNHSCEGCHNPELWDFNIGEPLADSLIPIYLKLHEAKQVGFISQVWILGGEPLDHPLDSFKPILRYAKDLGLSTVLWTHYDSCPSELIGLVDYVKVGPYIQGGEEYRELVLGIKLANKEQKIIDLR